MKKYTFSNLAATWWAEYQVDGMQTTDNQKVLGIRSMSVGGTVNPTDIDPTMAALGLPVHYGVPFTEVEWIELATAQNLNLVMTYENLAGVTKSTALTLQATPTFSPVAGAVPWGTTVTIASASADAIYYTKDGNVPTTASTNQATTACVISAPTLVKAIATKSGKYKSAVGSAAYTQAAAAAPTAINFAVGGATPVGGVTDPVVPAAGGTDSTGAVTGWAASTANKFKITVTDAASTASTITINGAAYISTEDYEIAAATPLTVVITTTRENYATTVRTLTVAVTAA